jgi:hypothetical protein
MRRDFFDLRESRIKQARLESRLSAQIEAIGDQLDPLMKGWSPLGGTGAKDDASPIEDLPQLRDESRRAYHRRAYGRNIIRTFVKFTVGKGLNVDFAEKDEEALTAVLDWWKQFTTINRWASFVWEFATRYFRDGETFVRRFEQDEGPLVLRFVDPERVGCNEHSDNVEEGIETDPNDAELVVGYHVTRKDLSCERIDASEVIHAKFGVDRNTARGRPILESVFPFMGKYDKWLDARMALNLIRASVALVREVQGSSTDLSRIRSKHTASSTSSETDRTKMLRPGTIISATPGVKYSMLSPNLDARDAATDGRTILLGAAAASGLPDVFVTSDYAEANFASTVVAQNPAVRGFEESEMLLSEPFGVIVSWVIDDGISHEAIPSEISANGEQRPVNRNFDINFPPLLRRDIGQENNAFESMNDHGVVSRRTWGINMGLDPDKERTFLEEEAESTTSVPARIRSERDRAPRRVEDRQPRQNVNG